MYQSWTTSERTRALPFHRYLAVFLSLLIPGLGQFLLGRRSRGLLIFLAAAVSTFLIAWSLINQKIGIITLGRFETSWLWLPLNSYSGFGTYWMPGHYQPEKCSASFQGYFFVALILYVIAWNVTDVKLNRLVERFNDARTVATNPAHTQNMITLSVNGNDQICAWTCMSTYVSDRVAGRTPAGTIRVSDNLLDIIGRMKLLPASQMAGKPGPGNAGRAKSIHLSAAL